MRAPIILRYVSVALLLNAGFLLLSSGVSALCSDTAFFPLLYSALLAALFGLFPLIFIPPQKNMLAKEGLAIVVHSWLVSCLIGMLPYVLWAGDLSFTDAWFESVSGYTTTGSTILRDIEALPTGLLFWRSSTHFLGGLGILIFVLAILPSMGMPGTILYRSESSALARQEFPTTARRAILVLFWVYLGLTGLETLVLLVFGLGPLDALTTAFGTVATGGFSVRQESIAAYGSLGVETVVMVFMILSGLHFGLVFSAVRGRWRPIFRSRAVLAYLVVFSLSLLIVIPSLRYQNGLGWGTALREGAFQVISVGTSTGFATADSSVWPPIVHFVLVYLTLQCACAGSTSGGIKVDRIFLFVKAFLRKLRESAHPREVITLRVGGKTVEEKAVAGTVLYIVCYLVVVFLSASVLTGLGVPSLESFTAAAATMGNVGPGLGFVGSTGSFAAIPAAGKWVLSLTMLLGRLEIYGLLLVFTRGFYR